MPRPILKNPRVSCDPPRTVGMCTRQRKSRLAAAWFLIRTAGSAVARQRRSCRGAAGWRGSHVGGQDQFQLHVPFVPHLRDGVLHHENQFIERFALGGDTGPFQHPADEPAVFLRDRDVIELYETSLRNCSQSASLSFIHLPGADIAGQRRAAHTDPQGSGSVYCDLRQATQLSTHPHTAPFGMLYATRRGLRGWVRCA